MIKAIHRELHERISIPVTAPCRVRHSAYLLGGDQEQHGDRVRSMFQDILGQLRITPATVQRGERAGYCEKEFGDGSLLRLVWELHSEFYSYTTVFIPAAKASGGDDFVEPFRLPEFPTLGEKLVDLDITVIKGTALKKDSRAFLWGGTIYGGRVINGEARTWTTFQVNEGGQGRYVIGAGSLKPGRLGTLMRRIVEIENYYHLVLLPLPEYREQIAHLRQAENRITARSEEIARELAQPGAAPETEQRWLANLTRDLAELIRLTEKMRYRLSAADSYFAIFEERLHWMREEPAESFQSMREFLTARVSPAIRNYRNFIERADALTAQLTLLGNMMRTRVNVNLEKQGLQTMEAMNRRAALQLLLQRTVEGLSLIVLSYYLTGLANYVFKALEPILPLPGSATDWSALSIPVWLGLSFWITHRIKAKIKLPDREG